jgi:hypothetical protein
MPHQLLACAFDWTETLIRLFTGSDWCCYLSGIRAHRREIAYGHRQCWHRTSRILSMLWDSFLIVEFSLSVKTVIPGSVVTT